MHTYSYIPHVCIIVVRIYVRNVAWAQFDASRPGKKVRTSSGDKNARHIPERGRRAYYDDVTPNLSYDY